jgi:hypothetical protein
VNNLINEIEEVLRTKPIFKESISTRVDGKVVFGSEREVKNLIMAAIKHGIDHTLPYVGPDQDSSDVRAVVRDRVVKSLRGMNVKDIQSKIGHR